MSDGLTMLGEPGKALTEQQEKALDALREGHSFAEAAKQAEIGRATLYRWVQSNPPFKAAYNAWQREVAESGRARLLKLSEKAIAVLEQALDRGDEQIALQMLRHTGVMRRQRSGSTDVEVLDLQIQLKHRQDHQKATEAMLHHLLGKAGMSPRKRRQIINGRLGDVFMKQLAPKTPAVEPEKVGETAAAQPESQKEPNSNGQKHDAAAKSQLRQEMEMGGRLGQTQSAGETQVETKPGVSHDLTEAEKLQLIAGWRVGTQLHGVP